jgi:hypothetical protein
MPHILASRRQQVSGDDFAKQRLDMHVGSRSREDAISVYKVYLVTNRTSGLHSPSDIHSKILELGFVDCSLAFELPRGSHVEGAVLVNAARSA